jgi:hypothetical protein
LLSGAGLHFIGGDENVVGAGGYFHGGLANALENLGEIIEHVVDGVGDVAEGVVGNLAAQGQFAARNLVDDGQQLGDAALQRLAGFLVAVGLGDLGDSAIQILRDVAEVVVGLNVGARAGIAGSQALREFRELMDRRDDATEAPRQNDADDRRDAYGDEQAGTFARATARLFARAEGEPYRPRIGQRRSGQLASRSCHSIAISSLPPKLISGLRSFERRRLARTQIDGPGKFSRSRGKSKTRASRSSWRSIPTQCGTFSGACRSMSSEVTE